MWGWIAIVAKAAIVLNIGVAVWLIGFRSEAEPPPVLPDTAPSFSLDLRVNDRADHQVVYAVEQRARPHYRIFSFDPSDGAVTTIYTVPEDAIIFDIALSPDATKIAVAYAEDFELDGSGVYVLSLDDGDGQLVEWTTLNAGVYLTDLAWTSDGEAVLATSVDRRGDDEVLQAVRLEEDAEATVIADEAINPVELDGTVYFLTVGENLARRSIGVADGTPITVGEEVDLDHLTADADAGVLRVAAIDLVDTGLDLGTAAEAHGSHDVPATWWEIDPSDATNAVVLELEPIIVYDAASTASSIVYATSEGLAIGTDQRIDVIASRAIRFVAA